MAQTSAPLPFIAPPVDLDGLLKARRAVATSEVLMHRGLSRDADQRAVALAIGHLGLAAFSDNALFLMAEFYAAQGPADEA
ncbi:hypothetical protein [Methylobacterium aquaticum]|uniref:Uncharacterized protein n=1 Tax=Methylobacterium aquaticum TaxID=270351 RepID=A0A0C6FP26_9HYPH|nr:hypothetical protein [Methylobacterium aquaticum]BAQ44365.1 hypothetical protein Maq22A_c04795 [Methylobacterium aquaticum]